MADEKNPDADSTGTEKPFEETGTPPDQKPVDEKAQSDAAKERAKTGGYQ
ncbi:hypothetical protein [Pseudoroseomonas cervicalis]|nr:hypothetical protein [Pseudoroseomonas cervicalis]MDQ1078766.1 hypothetical protein [Pseudoroseomonas cervicalis]